MYKLRTRLFLVILSMIIVLTTSGCWSSVELNDRAFVSLILVDLTDDGDFELTLGFPLPNRMIPGEVGGSGGSSREPFAYVTKTGPTLPQALQDIQNDLSRRITFGQTRLLVIGSTLAKHGLDPVLEFISRRINFHISANLFVTPGKVLELVETPTTFERFVSVILTSYITHRMTIDATLRDVLLARYGSGDILIPTLSFSKAPETIAKKEKSQIWLGVDGAAMFVKGKMIGQQLNKVEMQTSLLLYSNIREMTIRVESPTDGKEITFNVEDITTKFKAKVRDDTPGIRLETRGTASVQASDSKLDLQNDEQLMLLQKELDREIKSRIMQLINKTRTAKADVFQLGNYIKWKHPDIWDKYQSNWNEFYAKGLDIEAAVKIRIRGTGEAFRSIRTEWGEGT
ncbi:MULTISPECIES: Ger(x)C family spore germination protein [Paenibacillus]|uniref:Ger(X)C family spore germination protein n=1 Tax=Paenibacillus woosongensis TaxID=307580 RepID=A0A7X3CQ04_9BACL|nr:Ger(x)C family spore germination protein [Paenibacillus woosongensis]MUG47444.1 Ger(x)C family spore germination protein [Paenibacillus woosongensis]